MTWWIVGGVLFGVIVVALLIYGIVTHRTRGMEGEASTLDKLKLTPDWPPLTLVVDGRLLSLEEDIIEAVKAAAKWWEEETGRRYFVPPGELTLQGHVVPIMPAPEKTKHDPDHAFAYVEPRVDTEGFLATAAVYLMPGWEEAGFDKLTQAMKHELGHCLGLAHDGDARSIMWPKIGSRGQFVSPNDTKVLEELYPKLPGETA